MKNLNTKQKVCIKCGRQRSISYMQQAVFRSFPYDEAIDVWRCAGNESCKQARKQARNNAEAE